MLDRIDREMLHCYERAGRIKLELDIARDRRSRYTKTVRVHIVMKDRRPILQYDGDGYDVSMLRAAVTNYSFWLDRLGELQNIIARHVKFKARLLVATTTAATTTDDWIRESEEMLHVLNHSAEKYANTLERESEVMQDITASMARTDIIGVEEASNYQNMRAMLDSGIVAEEDRDALRAFLDEKDAQRAEVNAQRLEASNIAATDNEIAYGDAEAV